ncbi:TIGR02678 family protein [Saccharopolyspora rosea]|uniref:TIGR02678 family protein n=1 Tax=Saccharopolyspora rosea TaxID=524884 RepID=UPI0021D9ACC9|nr:TIGR02678 family protein [Saccharopolyspora rosea]
MSTPDMDLDELRSAARTLVCRPLLRAGGPEAKIAALVRRPAYRAELQRWFERNLGWRLVVDRDVVRLHKIPADSPAHSRDAPSQRCCVLYCLLLASLEECGEQTVLTELAEHVTLLAASRPGIPAYDATQLRDRRELVKAIRLLVEHGALVPTRDAAATQEDESAYVTGSGNAIYDIDHRAAALLLACPVPPTRAGTPAGLTDEPVPDTQDGHNRHRRHVLMRRLVDDPVLYLDDLPEDQQAYFYSQRHSLLRELERMLDVRVEVRAEGAAVIDDVLTDIRFPQDRTAQFAALLLAGALAEEPGVRSRENFVVGSDRLAEISHWLADKVGNYVRTIQQHPVTPKTVLDAAREMLVELHLVELLPDGVRVLAALGRYRNNLPDRVGSPSPTPLFDVLDRTSMADTSEGGARDDAR